MTQFDKQRNRGIGCLGGVVNLGWLLIMFILWTGYRWIEAYTLSGNFPADAFVETAEYYAKYQVRTRW